MIRDSGTAPEEDGAAGAAGAADELGAQGGQRQWVGDLVRGGPPGRR